MREGGLEYGQSGGERGRGEEGVSTVVCVCVCVRDRRRGREGESEGGREEGKEGERVSE